MKFVLATFNRDKAREFAALLALPGTEVVSLREWPEATPPDETGATLQANARIKALAAVRLTGLPAISDDTGLEVDALGGAPGVHAARFAGPDATYADNVARLLASLQGVPAARRTARFRTVCLALHPDGREWAAEGVLKGRIGEQPRGAHGFGYDPVFVLPDGRTLAEFSASEKNAISHRALAVRGLATRLGGV